VAGCDRSLSRVSKGARANNCHGPRLALTRHCERLNNLTVLHVHQDRLDALDDNTVASDFEADVDLRVKWFGKLLSKPLYTQINIPKVDRQLTVLHYCSPQWYTMTQDDVL